MVIYRLKLCLMASLLLGFDLGVVSVILIKSNLKGGSTCEHATFGQGRGRHSIFVA